jgi:ABC-type amino acid transport substrate-binding protein
MQFCQSFFVCFFFTSGFSFDFSPKDFKPQEKFSETLSKALSGNYPTVHILSASFDSNDQLNMVLPQILSRLSTSVVVETVEKIEENILRSFSIFLINSMIDFFEIDAKVTQNLFRFQGRYLIVCTEMRDQCDFERIFELLWSKQIRRVVIFSVTRSSFTAKTFNPFNNRNCNDVTPVDLDNSIEIFPSKLNDMKNCSVKICAFDLPPFTLLKESKLLGRDGELITTISKALNFKLDIDIVNGSIPWGYLNVNGTATGAMEKLLKNESDLIIGDYFLKADRLKFFDNSDPYFESKMVFVIPVAEPLSSFEKLAQPFESPVWFCLIGVICSGIFVIFITKLNENLRKTVFGENVKTPGINMVMAFLGVSQPRIPKTSFARYILMKFIILCLVIRSIYQGSLYKFLQSDESYKQVKSVDEMIEKDYKFFIGRSHQDLMPESSVMFER